MIKISIIVPVYNAEKNLNRCLESLVMQTLQELEIIIVDDASTDNSKAIIEKYEKLYPNKIKAIRNPENKEIGKTRNVGAESASGKYIGFVDSDDYVDVRMYEKYYEFAEQNKADVVTGHYYKVRANKVMVHTSPFFEVHSLKEYPKMLIELEYGPCNKIFKRTLILKHQILFDENRKYEDMLFVLKSIYYSARVAHINDAYYYYRVGHSSETTTMDKRVFDMFQIMEEINALLKDHTWLQEELEMLNIIQFTRYMLQQRNQAEKGIRNQFIDKAYQYLYQNFPNWRKNKYYIKTNQLKQWIKNNQRILSFYCNH